MPQAASTSGTSPQTAALVVLGALSLFLQGCEMPDALGDSIAQMTCDQSVNKGLYHLEETYEMTMQDSCKEVSKSDTDVPLDAELKVDGFCVEEGAKEFKIVKDDEGKNMTASCTKIISGQIREAKNSSTFNLVTSIMTAADQFMKQNKQALDRIGELFKKAIARAVEKAKELLETLKKELEKASKKLGVGTEEKFELLAHAQRAEIIDAAVLQQKYKADRARLASRLASAAAAAVRGGSAPLLGAAAAALGLAASGLAAKRARRERAAALRLSEDTEEAFLQAESAAAA